MCLPVKYACIEICKLRNRVRKISGNFKLREYSLSLRASPSTRPNFNRDSFCSLQFFSVEIHTRGAVDNPVIAFHVRIFYSRANSWSTFWCAFQARMIDTTTSMYATCAPSCMPAREWNLNTRGERYKHTCRSTGVTPRTFSRRAFSHSLTAVGAQIVHVTTHFPHTLSFPSPYSDERECRAPCVARGIAQDASGSTIPGPKRQRTWTGLACSLFVISLLTGLLIEGQYLRFTRLVDLLHVLECRPASA